MKYILLVVLFLVGCAGKDGSPGVNGLNGNPGNDGHNGTDNRFVKGIQCGGNIVDPGIWNGTAIDYVAYTTTSGDVFVNVSVSNLGTFNSTNSMFYSKNQIGSIKGSLSVNIDNSNVFIFEHGATFLDVDVISSNGGSGTFTIPCVNQTY